MWYFWLSCLISNQLFYVVDIFILPFRPTKELIFLSQTFVLSTIINICKIIVWQGIANKHVILHQNNMEWIQSPCFYFATKKHPWIFLKLVCSTLCLVDYYTGSSPFSKLENTTKTSLHDDFLWLDQPFHAAAAEL